MADITHLRKMSGAGMMDCKKALEEAGNDFEKAMEIIRKKGQAVAAKRSDREAAEGCVLAADKGDFAAIVALKCETDFVAKNADFVALTQDILNAAMTGRPATKEALLATTLKEGRTVENHITDRIGVTEREVARDKARQAGKPEALLDRIAEGALQNYFKENTLLQQEYVKDSKLTVQQYLQQHSKTLTVTAFKRVTLNVD